MAFLSVGLVSLPITISPGMLGSALGGFAVSALAGYYGTRLIDRLTKNFVAEEKESAREEKATSGE